MRKLFILLGAIAAFTAALNLPVEVSNWAETARTGEPVTAGIPLPEKTVYDLSTLRITDASGNTVPAQFKTLSKWWKEKNSGQTVNPSVKWVLCDFQATVGSKNKSAFFLKDDNGNTTPAKAITLTEETGLITVVTGPLKFTLSKTAFNLFDEAWLDADNNGTFEASEKVIASGNQSGGFITAGDWTAGGCTDGTLHRSSKNAPTRIVIEENGPMKTLIRVEGRHYADANGLTKGLYGYQCFITAYAGKAYVDVQWAITNMHIEGNRPPEKTTGGTAWAVYSWPFKKYTLSLDLNLSATATQPYSLLGSAEQNGNAGTTAARLFQGKTGFTLTGASNGTQAKGGVSLSDGTLGVRAVMRDFCVNSPKAMSVVKNRIDLELFPDTGAKFWLEPQTRKNHRLRLEFFSGAPASGALETLYKGHDAPLRMLATDRAWYRNTRSWERGFGVPVEPVYNRRAPSAWTRMDKAAYRTYLGLPDWESYGQIEEFNGGGDHTNLTTCFLGYVLSGNPADFERYEAMVHWFNDRVQCNYPSDAFQTFAFYFDPIAHGPLYRYCHSFGGDAASPVLSSFPGYSVQPALAYSHNPDDGHMTQLQQMEYYQLTGDPATLDAIKGLGLVAAGINISRIYIWGHNEDGGAPPLTDSVSLDSVFLMPWGPRYVARPAMVSLHAYEFTDDPRYLYSATLGAYSLRNYIRRNPFGYMANAGEQTYCSPEQTPWATDHPGVAIPSYFAGSDFQIGIGMESMYSYLVRTESEEVRDALIQAGASMLWRMNQDSLGRWSGFVYSGWSDYGFSGKRYNRTWSLSSCEESYCPGGRGYYSSSSEGFGGFNFSYLASGRTDFLPVIRDGWAAWGESFQQYGETKAINILECLYKRDSLDATPPSTITDLAATAVPGSGIRLSWTAPGGNGATGRAVRYQVKAATVPLCDMPARWDSTTKKGWPDMNEPLPYTATALLKKASDYLATQEMSFWAAKNVDNEPVPQAAGSSETMNLVGLDSSFVWHIALVAYDSAGNVSGISNVATSRGTSVESGAGPSGGFALLNALPNPFNPSVTLRCVTGAASNPFSLKIYDTRGRLVQTLFNGVKSAGTHAFVWNGRNSEGVVAGSGVYIYELKSGKNVKRLSMVMAK